MEKHMLRKIPCDIVKDTNLILELNKIQLANDIEMLNTIKKHKCNKNVIETTIKRVEHLTKLICTSLENDDEKDVYFQAFNELKENFKF